MYANNNDFSFLQCFGLLGSNGAGKSTVFSMLSGEMVPTSGSVCISNRDDGVAYCPQSNALDSLLTVEEIIHFYGNLRRIQNILEVNKHINVTLYIIFIDDKLIVSTGD